MSSVIAATESVIPFGVREDMARLPGWPYVLRRIGQAVISVWGAFTLAFFVLRVVPGDPVLLIAGGIAAGNASEAQLQAIRAEFGLDRPIVVQYFDYIWRALHGDFGASYYSRSSVASLLADALPNTLALVAVSAVFTAILGLLVGTGIVYARSRGVKWALGAMPAIGVAIPSFLTGILLLRLFSFQWHVFPAVGGEGLSGLILPALTLSVGSAAVISQVFSSSLRSATRASYAEIARAKGASRRRMFFVHGYPNALLPTVTLSGLVIAGMFAHAVVVEIIFSRNGIGSMMQRAVLNKDIPVVLAIVLLVATVYVVLNLVVDLLYPLIDPRITVASRRLARAVKIGA